MAQYRWSICEPNDADVIEMGTISKEKILETFEQFPWTERLRQMSEMKDREIQYSPSLEFENLESKQGLTFSIVGDLFNYEFYIFYKRPATVRYLFGLVKREMNDWVTEITGQTKEEALKILTAFLNNDTIYLEEKIK